MINQRYLLQFYEETFPMLITKRKCSSQDTRRTVTSINSRNDTDFKDDSDTTNGTKQDCVCEDIIEDGILSNKEETNYNNKSSYWLTRIIILRSIGFVYFVAFLVALHQNKQLIGKDGLLPAHKYLNNIKQRSGGINCVTFTECPSIIQFLDYENHIDSILDLIAYLGLTLSIFLMISGAANWIVMLILWTLNHSLVNIGQKWYEFGWETQLLETGFLATFLCPVWDLSTLPKHTPTSRIVIWAFRWLLSRRILGAGLIKIRGDNCWRDLTCMNYHYEVVLIISGNLIFLNWLTIVPCLACFDDKSLWWMFSGSVQRQVIKRQNGKHLESRVRKVFTICLGALLLYLSVPVVMNLLSSQQRMNKYYGPLRLLNSYGAFGSVTKTRTDLILQGTSSNNPNDPKADWLEYEFKCKPGNITRRPCIISPYHYRLDWMIWVAAFQKHSSNEWIGHLVVKLLVNDEGTSSLLAFNPFLGQSPPKFIRIQKYKYKYTKYNSPEGRAGKWWKRLYIGSYLAPVSLDTSRDLMRKYNWNIL